MEESLKSNGYNYLANVGLIMAVKGGIFKLPKK